MGREGEGAHRQIPTEGGCVARAEHAGRCEGVDVCAKPEPAARARAERRDREERVRDRVGVTMCRDVQTVGQERCEGVSPDRGGRDGVGERRGESAQASATSAGRRERVHRESEADEEAADGADRVGGEGERERDGAEHASPGAGFLEGDGVPDLHEACESTHRSRGGGACVGVASGVVHQTRVALRAGDHRGVAPQRPAAQQNLH